MDFCLALLKAKLDLTILNSLIRILMFKLRLIIHFSKKSEHSEDESFAFNIKEIQSKFLTNNTYGCCKSSMMLI